MLKIVCEEDSNTCEIEMEGLFSEVYAELCMAVLKGIDGLAEQSKQDDVTVEETKSALIYDFTDMLKTFK